MRDDVKMIENEWGGDERLGWLKIWIDDWNIPIYLETLVCPALAFQPFKDIQKSPLAQCWMLQLSPWEEQIEKQI